MNEGTRGAGSWQSTLDMLLPRPGFKRWLAQGMGGLLIFARPAAARRIASQGTPRTRLQRWVMGTLISRHAAAGTLEELAELRRRFWESDEAHSYHQTHSMSRGQEFVSASHKPFLDRFVAAVDEARLSSLVEVGCGTGRLLSHLAERTPGLRRHVGLDLSAQQIAANRAQGLAGLEFEAGDMRTWIPAHCGPGWAYCFYGGVLEYLQQDELAELMRWIASRGPACVGLVEPIGDFDAAREQASRPYRTEFSFAHNYAFLLQEAGFTVAWQTVDSARFLCLVATRT